MTKQKYIKKKIKTMINQNDQKDTKLSAPVKFLVGMYTNDQQMTDSVIDRTANSVGNLFQKLPLIGWLFEPVCQKYPDPDPVGFNEVFVAANWEIRNGASEGLHGAFEGVRRAALLFRDAEKFGHHVPALQSAVLRFELALKRYDEKKREGGFTPEDDLYCHTQLCEAWEWIKLINDWLISQGLGFVPVPDSEEC